MNTRISTTIAALTVAAIFSTGLLPSAAVAEQAEAAGSEYVLAIEGMSCAIGCPPAIKSMLEGIDGVTGVSVDFESRTAKVSVEGDHQLNSEACSKALGNSGYTVASISPAQ